MSLWMSSAAVYVSDRKKAARWYREMLGLTVVQDDAEHWLTVGNRRRGGRIHLCEVPRGRKLTPRSTGDSGILLLTDEELPRLYQRLSRKGVKFPMPPRKLPWGWVSKLSDPDGNILWLCPPD